MMIPAFCLTIFLLYNEGQPRHLGYWNHVYLLTENFHPYGVELLVGSSTTFSGRI